MDPRPLPVFTSNPTPLPSQSKHTVMSLLWHEGTQSLLTTTRDELAVIQMTRDEQIKAAQTSHDFPISSALYSEKFNLFITADSLGQITTWDLGSGEKILSWEAHPSAVVSAMCLGCNGKRLISAVGRPPAHARRTCRFADSTLCFCLMPVYRALMEAFMCGTCFLACACRNSCTRAPKR